jgi:hypothetical protein
MFCPQCGTQHPDEASFCPACGAWVGADLPGQLPRPRLSLTRAFGDAAAALFTRRAGGALPVLAGTWLLVGLVVAAGAVVTILAGFGTIWPRRIVNTSCFVRTNDPSGYFVSRPGHSTEYWERLPNCDVTRINPDWALMVLVGLLALAAALLVGAIATTILYRLAAHVIDGDRPTLPPPDAMLRAAKRVVGWGAVLAACCLAAAVAWGIIVAVLVGVAGGFGILIVIGASIYLIIWWIVPLLTRATLSIVLMVIDDVGFSECWAACDVTLGQAWGYFGLAIAAGIGFSLIGQVVNAFGSQGDALAVAAFVVSLLLSLAQYLFFAIYAVLVAHGLSDGRPRPSLSV